MLNLDQLYCQKIMEKINYRINEWFNSLIGENVLLGRILAFFIVFYKCVLHTIGILANTLEYGLRGFLYLFSNQGSVREYFSTLGSFLVINTINAITVIPDIFIRTYFAIKDAKISREHTLHTLYYKIMRLI